MRKVIQTGRGQSARPISEELALLSKFPENAESFLYKIGIGDTLTFSRLIENNQSALLKTSTWPKQNVTTNYKLGIGDTIALKLIKKENVSTTTVPSGNKAKTYY